MRTKLPVLSDILTPDANNFGAIRLAMALAVLVSHSYWLATGQPSLEPLHTWTHHSLGEHAVQVFFFLSGVVVTQSLFKSKSVVDFAAARAFRIFPALIACVLLTAFVLGPLATTGSVKAYFADKGVITYIAKTLSLSTGAAPLPGVFTNVPVPNLVNLSLWTLKYEVLCYTLLALFGLACLRLPKLQPAFTAALALIVALIFVGAPKPISGYTMTDNIRYFVLFFGMGTLAFMLRRQLVLYWPLLPLLGIGFVLAIGTRFAELTSALFLGYGTLLVAALKLPRLRWFTNDQDYSYAVYILACPIQQALLSARPGIGPIELTLVTLGLVLPMAVFSWTHIERPAMHLRRPVVAWIGRRAETLRHMLNLSAIKPHRATKLVAVDVAKGAAKSPPAPVAAATPIATAFRKCQATLTWPASKTADGPVTVATAPPALRAQPEARTVANRFRQRPAPKTDPLPGLFETRRDRAVLRRFTGSGSNLQVP